MFKAMNYLDLFSGIGGFHKGLEEAGFKFDWTGHSEIDKYAKSIYQGHFKESEDLGDVSNINVRDLPEIDLITFGFPCQDLSVAGKRGGLKAKRSGLFYKAMDIVRETRPQYFIWENVMGLLSSHDGCDIVAVETEMYKSGYIFDYAEQNTRWYLPQNRQRIYCVGVDLLWIGREIIRDGQTKKTDLLKTIIKGYLLNKLQQNLEDQKSPQELNSIELALDWLITKKLPLSGHKLKLRYLKIISELASHGYPNLYLDIQNKLSNSKDTSLDWFINLHQNSQAMDMLLNIPMEQLPESIAKLWQNISEENLLDLNKCIISIIAKQTIKSETFSFVVVDSIIDLYITRLKVLFPDLWNSALSSLIQEQENMKYAENRRDKNGYSAKDDNFTLPFSDTERKQNESVGYPRGSCRQQIFPIGEEFENARGEGKGFKDGLWSQAIDSNYYKGPDGKRTMIFMSYSGVGRKLQERNIMPPLRANTSAGHNDFILHAQRQPLKFIDRNQKNIESDYAFTVYSMNTGGVKIEQHYSISCDCGCTFDGVLSDKCPKCGEIQGGQTNEIKIVQKGRGFNKGGEKDICPTISTSSFEHNNHVIVPEATKKGYAFAQEGDSINLDFLDSKTRKGRVGKGVAQTLDTGHQYTVQSGVRRFTPIECERLQGFPDNWTKYGKDGELISDTQRYKCLGNAVSVPVVKAVGERIFK